MIWRIRFQVYGGAAPFPIDMLRYDGCYPATEADSAAITRSFFPIDMLGRDDQRGRHITLEKHSTRRRWEPTYGRWNSFLWHVDENDRTEDGSN